MTPRNRTSSIGITASIGIGLLIALAGAQGSTQVGGLAVFALCGIIAFAIQFVVYVPSYLARTEHYYDLTGSATYLTTVAVAVLASDDLDARAIVIALLVVAWASRLGTFLFRRVKRDGGDGRFDKIKHDPVRFFMMWSIQGLWVFLTAACALAIITSAQREPFGVFAVIGLVVWIIGFAIEVTADNQKKAFRADPANQGRFINVGLWAWSRHPNYFGEIVLWTGVAITALPILSGWRWVMLISPVFVFALLTRVSGVPMLEARSDEKWGAEPGYQEYKATTPTLLLRPPSTR
jgi:steroid 5-alpha reductase family enzyme